MPRYKVQRVDEQEIELVAHRVVQVGDAIIFERLIGPGRWEEVRRMRADTVARIRRQVQAHGTFRHYLPATPVPRTVAGRS